MEHNKPFCHQDPLPGLNQLIQQARDNFYKKLKYFIRTHSSHQPQVVKFVKGGLGFLLFSPKQQPTLLSSLIQYTFACSYQEFVRQANRFGFSVKSKERPSEQVIMFLGTEKLGESVENQLSESFSCSEEEDEFPQEEEMEAIIREREDKVKSAFVKPNIILNKAQSEGNACCSEVKRQEDASIEFKLKQIDFSSPLGKAQENGNPKSEEPYVAALTLADRVRLEKENYEKCSKLIDSTIIELLEAHRAKKVEECKQNLMERVVQIYDLLSNSIENSSRVVPGWAGPELKNDEE